MSARYGPSGMGFMEVSVLQRLMTPWTTDRTTFICPPSKSRSLHRSPNSSLCRRPVVASIKIKMRDFIDKQDERYPVALGALPNEMDGIIIKQFVSASMIKQHAHDVLDLRARRA